jgi:Protein of unknown function (DUF4231)
MEKEEKTISQTQSHIIKEQEQKLLDYYEKVENLPSNTEQHKFFMLLLNTKIAQIEKKEQRSSSQKMWLRLTALVLSTAVTIVLGFKWDVTIIPIQYQSNIALTISALVTLLAAIASFWDIDNYWLHIRVMLEKLKLLRYRYAYLLSTSPEAPPNEGDMNALMMDFNSIVGDGYWEKLNTKDTLPKGLENLSDEQMTLLLKTIKDVKKE